jgi:competence protein ComEA
LIVAHRPSLVGPNTNSLRRSLWRRRKPRPYIAGIGSAHDAVGAGPTNECRAGASAPAGEQPRSRAIVLLAAAATLLTFTPARAQQLPDGPGKDATIRTCGVCHAPERSASVRLTREGWEDVIARMVALGAKGSDEDLKAVLDYLSSNFEGRAMAPLNLNRATSQELEAIVGLFRRESAAWIAYRTKVGPCGTLEDLKKVPGVDFRKVEKRRDRLVCF